MREFIWVDGLRVVDNDTTGGTIDGVVSTPEKHCPCRVQIPLVYNDGTEVEAETLTEILSVFNRQFGGYTPLGDGSVAGHNVVGGSWHGQVEPSMRIEVAVLERRVPELKEVIFAIGKRLGQKEMYFDAPPPSVEFVKIEDYLGDQSIDEGGA